MSDKSYTYGGGEINLPERQYTNSATAKADEMYRNTPQEVREDIVEAAIWARETLTNHEGSGHSIHVMGQVNGQCFCCFAKPEWGGDHSGSSMDTGAEAIVMAVCEYLSGC